MNLTIVWTTYPAHSTPGLMLQRPVDIINPDPSPPLPSTRELVLARYGVTVRG